ncbi:MAG: alpha-amylase family protein [Bacteroidota bacterium]
MTRLFGNLKATNAPWGTREQNGVGKFNDFSEKSLREIRNMGFTHIWYTGVIEHALLTDFTDFGIPLNDADVVKGRAGSPYAIKDYYDVNPDLADSVPNRMEEFEALIHRSHQAGLQVLLDFVPNHVAREYASDAKPHGTMDFGEEDDRNLSFHPQNNFYYVPGEDFQVPKDYDSLGPHAFPTKDGHFAESPAKVTGNDVFSAHPSVDDWFETIKLNYGIDYLNGGTKHFDPIPDTWIKMRDILLFWAAKGVDGFRCDMAEMVPVEFWKWVIREVKRQYPAVTFTAEIYNPGNYRNYIFLGGFDYLYDKVELYDTLKGIIQDRSSTDQIPQVWQSQEGIGDHMLRFLENHDEQRIASRFFAGDMRKGIPMMALSAFMHRGPIMIYFGQEVGEPALGDSGFSSDDGRTTIFDYWGVPEHQKWLNQGAFDGKMLPPAQAQLRQKYIEILRATNDRPAIRQGGFFDLHYFNRNHQYHGYSDRIFTFLRHSEKEVLLIAVNLREADEEVQLKIPEDAWQKMGMTTPIVIAKEQEHSITFARQSTVRYEEQTELRFIVPAVDYVILQLNSKT